MSRQYLNQKSVNHFLYIIINIVLLLSVLFLFKCNYLPELYCLRSINTSLFSLLFIVFFVHIIKALRLYIAFYGTKINTTEYIETYCKVTPVSIILPFKLGEIFRIYSFGYITGNYLKSTIIILLDRFMDTVALLSIMVVLAVLNKDPLLYFVYLLIIFVLFLLFVYKIFPNMYRYWKDYFLQEKATKNKLWCLDKLEILNKLYKEITKIIKGRGIILYLLSVFAWLIELSNLIIIKTKVTESVNKNVLDYLLSALDLTKSTELEKFITISILLLFIVYMMIKFIECFKKKEVCK